MTNNREKRVFVKDVHLYLALQRVSKQGKKNCIRTVIKDDELDLKILENKLKIFGGQWRIHKTVNSRSVEKARKVLLVHLINHPENASVVDSAWRTALLQKECVCGDKKFMLDIDTVCKEEIKDINNILKTSSVRVLDRIKTPKGWHYITLPFDTREVCKFDNVTLLRDGYYYIKTVYSMEIENDK